MAEIIREETLSQALRRCYGDASKSLYSQAKAAAYGVSHGVYGRWTLELGGIPVQGVLSRDCEEYHKRIEHVLTSAVPQQSIREATACWYKEGLSPATINKRLNCLSKMGVDVQGMRVKNPKQLKWHLKESDKPKVLEWLRDRPGGSQWRTLADFIEWTTATGLRIEESLRLTWGDLSADGTVSVPGLKTATSQATLPLGSAAKNALMGRHADGYDGPHAGEKVFKTDYEELHTLWHMVRKAFGWQDDPTATLKALRRSAARYLHVDCGMPLHMVQQYLRHESMDTTLEYLRLTGGYGTEEMRRFLK